MKLGINAFNIRRGGGITHLVELLSAANPKRHGFSKVIVWAPEETLDSITNQSWLIKKSIPSANNWLAKIFWMLVVFRRESKDCDILLIPGGSFLGFNRPYVTMLQNMLPFENTENKRYLAFSFISFIRYKLLYLTQSITLKKAQGAIYPSHYAKKIIQQAVKKSDQVFSAVIPHGIHGSFTNTTKDNLVISSGKTVRLLYVSIIDIYKHQWHVVKAIKLLRDEGFDVELDLIGPVGNMRSLTLLNETIQLIDPSKNFIHYLGEIPYSLLPEYYKKADIFVFASSCESISSIIQEAMAAGLAIACSNKGAMNEFLLDAGVYFDPEDPSDIAAAVKVLLMDPVRSKIAAKKAQVIAMNYQWETCAKKTFSFIVDIAHNLPNYKNAVYFHEVNAEKFAARYTLSKAFIIRYKVWTRILNKFVLPGSKVLDLGCGSGVFSFFLSEFCTEVIGLDGSSEMLKLCNESNETHLKKNIFFHQEYFPLTVIDSSYMACDAIISSSVLEYIDDLEKTIANAFTMLKVGGYFIFSMPNSEGWYRKMERIFFKFFSYPKYYRSVKNVTSLDFMRKFMGKSGFSFVESIYFSCILGKFGASILSKRRSSDMFIAIYQKKSQ